MAQPAAAAPALLVLNAGSSSLKFALYHLHDAGLWRARARGQVEGLGTAPRLVARDGAGTLLADERLAAGAPEDRTALETLLGWLATQLDGERLLAVGHRVVHGGTRFTEPTLVTPGVLAELRSLEPLAPLHQPHNLDAIEAALARMPGIPQVACFDTSFHRDLPPVARLVPLPEELRRQGLQRYGFHGLSYEYVAGALAQVAPEIATRRVIVAHLGSGASLCAIQAGRSVDSTLGFTALDGLCMGTRPGSLDPGIVLHLFQGLGMSPTAVEDLLYRRSGLLGISGVSSDMRELLDSDAPSARLAVDYFVYRITREIGALTAVLGGLDGLVFTAGIGENAAPIRERVCEAAAWLGLALDREANARGGPRITRAGGAVSAWVIPTDEERVIARHTARLLGLARTS
jgi:acetate kinase